MKKKQREEHINFLLYKEIDMNLELASDLVFHLLKDVDVGDDELEELKSHFVMAKSSLDCLVRI